MWRSLLWYVKGLGTENLVIGISHENKRTEENGKHTCLLDLLLRFQSILAISSS